MPTLTIQPATGACNPRRRMFLPTPGKYFLHALFAVLVLASVSCRVSLIADRDEVFVNRVLETARKVDLLYLQLMSADSAHLKYANFAEAWNNTEVEIRQLRLMAEAHPLNRESSQICNLLLETFTRYKNQHQKADIYSPALLPIHRDRLAEYFIALLSVEKAKELTKP
jgi:hypothetical protein